VGAKTVRGGAPPAAENNFILAAGGADAKQQPLRNPLALIRCCNPSGYTAADQSRWFRKGVALKLQIREEDYRLQVAWAFGIGPYLRHRRHPLNGANEPTWAVLIACCIAWSVNIISNMQIRGSSPSDVEGEPMNVKI
jgi:hypothetical protein